VVQWSAVQEVGVTLDRRKASVMRATGENASYRESHERALLAMLLDGANGQRGLRAIERVQVLRDHADPA
jgi:hypothetical protein